jgi:hypothetical protein
MFIGGDKPDVREASHIGAAGSGADSCETADKAATIIDDNRAANRHKKIPSSGPGSGFVRLLALDGQGCRGMGRPPSLGLTFHFYLVIFIANVTGVTGNWIATGFCPVLAPHDEGRAPRQSKAAA